MQIRYFRRGHAQISMIFRDGPGDDSLLMLPIRTEKQHGFAPPYLTTEALIGFEMAIRQIGLVRTDKVDKHSHQIKIPSRACGLVGYDVALTRRSFFEEANEIPTIKPLPVYPSYREIVPQEFIFQREELDRYIETKKLGKRDKSIYWIERSCEDFWNVTQGVLNEYSISQYRDFILNKYSSHWSKQKSFNYPRDFLKTLSLKDNNFNPSYFLSILDPKKIPRADEAPVQVSDEDIINAITLLISSPLPDRKKFELVICLLFMIFTGQRSDATVAKITVGELKAAISFNPPVLLVPKEKDKNNFTHAVPLHPNLVSYLKIYLNGKMDDNEPTLTKEKLRKFFWKYRLKLIHEEDEYFTTTSPRHWFENKCDELELTQNESGYILTHGLNRIREKHYKHRKNYTDLYHKYLTAWKEVNIYIFKVGKNPEWHLDYEGFNFEDMEEVNPHKNEEMSPFWN